VAAVLIEKPTGSVLLHAQLADTQQRRLQGLMGRRSLPADAGMVFLFFSPTHAPFYMKDTTIPLSIAFFDASGKIIEIDNMDPCRSAPCPLYRPPDPYRGALEVNQGAFARWHVTVGDRVIVSPEE
jgi:uncharacterized membrane protein (UPF0127 family)